MATHARGNPTPGATLTPTERRVVEQVVRFERDYGAGARALYMRLSTFQSHMKSVHVKAQVTNVAGLTKYAIMQGIVVLPGVQVES